MVAPMDTVVAPMDTVVAPMDTVVARMDTVVAPMDTVVARIPACYTYARNPRSHTRPYTGNHVGATLLTLPH